MATKGRASKQFLSCVAILLIHMYVVNSQQPPQAMDMIVEFSQADAKFDHIREKRNATKTTNPTTTDPTNTALSNTNSADTHSTTIAAPITACRLNGSEYQCRCEDRCDECTVYGSCDDVTDVSCGCINALPNDGHLNEPTTELILRQTEYQAEIEIDTLNTAALTLLKNTLKKLSLPLINSKISITEITVTTVCSLTGSEYQCRCEDQFFWPTEKCMVYGSCDDVTNASCGCINTIPKDGNFCQPISELNSIHVISFSLKLIEEFDLALVDISSEKYKRYSKLIEELINKCYSSVSAYNISSAKVTGFRSGSVIADFSIEATSDNLNLVSANQRVVSILRQQDFNLTDDAISRTVKDGLYKSTNQIYPGNNMTLTCNMTANGSIIWTKDGNELTQSDKYTINKTALVVKWATPNDSGTYECRTTVDSMPYVVWQRIMIPDPNIQVNSSKVIKCGNLRERLQCCVQQNYKVEWTSSKVCSEHEVPRNSCIYCDYSIQENECQASGQNVTVTCKLAESIYSRSISINAVNKTFTCLPDDSANGAFGAGNLGENKTGDCNGDMVGYRIAQCNESGQWSVTYDGCVLRDIKYLKDSSQNLLVMDLPKFAKNVSKATAAWASEITKSPATILTIVELLKTIAKLSQNVTVNEDIMTDFLQTLDVIGSAEAQDAWSYLNSNSTTMMKSSELLNSTESIACRLLDKTFNLTTNYTSLNKYSNIIYPFDEKVGKNRTTQIYVPVASPKTSLTVIISSALNNILPVRNLTNYNNSQTGTSINGDVAVIETNVPVNNISLSFDTKNTTLGNPQCVFWNFTLLNGIGGWDSTGCQLKSLQSKPTTYTCECNHTTSFSILMSPFSGNDVILDYITYIGVAISMISLVLCLIIEIIVWKSVTRNDTSYMRHVSIVNIAVSLLIANICFIIAAAVVKKAEGPCSAATFFMHFFYLALFFWMFLSALFLLYRTLMVFSRMSKGAMMAIAFTVGYGAPLIIAVITVASTASGKGYTKEHHCWLNWDKTKALLAFVIPALTIVAINLLVLVVVLYKILRRGVNASTQPDDKHPLLVIARCVGILTPLFGLTWGFGVGTMVSKDFGVHLVFAFLNSLQGFFILLFGTLLDRKVRKELKGKLSLANLSSNLTRSTSAVPLSSGRFPFFPKLRKRDPHNVS